MKTKHILTALALPVMFAACTADDIEGLNNGMQQQDQRAKLSKDFVLNTSNEVDSRYVVEGSTALEFKFEEGDLIGANLIDAYEKSDFAEKFDPEDPATWKIVSYIAPALPFENIGENQWKSAGELGIGNYLFTNPYNPADKNRSAATYKLPIVIQYDSETPNAHLEDYNKAVAATILRKGDTQANISLKNIYTYPKIRINFPKEDGVSRVTKVILKRNGGFVYEGAFDNQAIADMFNTDTIAAALKADKDLTVEEYWAKKQTSDFVVETGAKTNPTLVYEMDEKVTANQLEVRLMIPSVESLLALAQKNDTHTDLDDVVTMYICTNEGNYKFALTDHTNYSFKGSTLAAVKDKALWRNKSNTLTVNAEKLNTASDSEIDELWAGNIVSTAEDWNALVEKYGDLVKYSDAYKNEKKADGTLKNEDADTLVVTIVGDEFALTSDLKMPEIAEFVIMSDVKVKGDVVLKNIEVAKAENAERKPLVTVKEGANLTVEPSFQADSLLVEKNAALDFTAAYDKKGKLINNEGVKTIDNYGTVTVPAGVKAMFALRNYKNISVLNVGAPASRATEAVAEATLKSGVNHGEVNNYGKINIAASCTFTNYIPTETAGYVLDEETSLYTEWPIFLNEGTVTVEGTLTNNTEFVNNGTLESNLSSSTFTNNKTLKVGASATTIIDDNTNGEIILSSLKPANFTIHGAKGNENYSGTKAGIIKYTATATELASLDLTGSPVTYLIANGNVDLKKTFNYTATVNGTATTVVKTLDVLEINGGDVKVAATTVSGTTTTEYAKVAKLVVASGKNTISSKINSISAIEIYKNSSLEVVEGSGELVMANLSITAPTTGVNKLEEEDKQGVFYMNGKMSLTVQTDTDGKIKQSEVSSYINLGKDGYIVAGKPTDTRKEDSMTAAVAKWIEKWNTGGEYVDKYASNPYDFEKFMATITYWEGKSWKWAKTIVDDLKEAYGVDGTEGETWADKMYDNDETPVDEFDSAVETYLKAVKATIDGEELAGATLAAAKFLTEEGKFVANPFENDYRNATYYAAVGETYDAVRLALASKNVTDNATAQVAATAWLLTDAQIIAAMAEVEASKYWFVWEDCDMEGLVDIWKYYSVNGADGTPGINYSVIGNARTGQQVVNWAKEIKSLIDPSGVKKEAQDALNSYTFQDLDKKYAGFSAPQVKTLVDKGEVTFIAGTPQ